MRFSYRAMECTSESCEDRYTGRFERQTALLTTTTAALFHDRRMQSVAEIGREFVNFLFAIDGNRLAGRIQYDFAVVALTYVALNLCQQFGVDLTVEVISKLA